MNRAVSRIFVIKPPPSELGQTRCVYSGVGTNNLEQHHKFDVSAHKMHSVFRQSVRSLLHAEGTEVGALKLVTHYRYIAR